MSVFVDTSAILAGIDGDDLFHEPAIQEWSRLLEESESLVTHSLVEVESAVLIQRRLGLGALRGLDETLLPRLEIVEVDRSQRRTAMASLIADGRRAVSLVDRVSFDLMLRTGVSQAFTFDRHFADAGFDLIGPA